MLQDITYFLQMLHTSDSWKPVERELKKSSVNIVDLAESVTAAKFSAQIKNCKLFRLQR